MLLRIAKRELLDMARDGRFRVACASVLLLLLTALAAGVVHQRGLVRERAAALGRDRRIWEDQGQKNPHSAAHYGVYAFKPREVLHSFDPGIDRFVGQSVWLEAHRQNMAQGRPVEDGTALQRFASLTAASVLQLLLPLMIVLLAFSAFSGEREIGTLRQLLSLGVPGRTLAWGKALGVAGALATVVVPATLVGVAALVLSGDTSQALPRSLLLALAYALYLGAFVGLSLAISAWAPSSRIALIGLLAFWILNGLVLPRLATDVAERRHPTPSATEFWARAHEDISKGIDGHNPADKRGKQLEERVLREYGVKRVEDLPVSFAGISLQAGEEYGNQVYDKHFGQLWDGYARQDATVLGAAVAAPLLAVRAASMGLSGTDFAHHRHFLSAAESYRRGFVMMLNDAMTQSAKGQDFDYLADSSLWRTAPRFAYVPPSVGEVWRGQAGAFLLLGAWCVLALAAATVAASRIKVA